MTSPRKKKLLVLIILLAIVAIVTIIPQLFFEKPKPGYGDEVQAERNKMNIVISTIESFKKSEGYYLDSVEPVMSMLSREMNLDFKGIHPQYVLAPDKNSFELCFDYTDEVPVTSCWSSQEKMWTITIKKSEGISHHHLS